MKLFFIIGSLAYGLFKNLKPKISLALKISSSNKPYEDFCPVLTLLILILSSSKKPTGNTTPFSGTYETESELTDLETIMCTESSVIRDSIQFKESFFLYKPSYRECLPISTSTRNQYL